MPKEGARNPLSLSPRGVSAFLLCWTPCLQDLYLTFLVYSLVFLEHIPPAASRERVPGRYIC